ncbi:MAG TPA: hypothetical protein VJS92_03785 [Candidatus Polarisedimenticolaceae bacterium]|nr:hypothetical protein [Candidatus Polarisedimenticolaceae bacterium]
MKYRMLAVTLAALAGFASAARAEIGAVCQLMPCNGGPYALGIIEDGDPGSQVWRRVSGISAARVVLNAEGEAQGDGRPSLLFNTVSNLAMVAWSRHTAGGYDVVLSTFVGGAWTAPVTLAGSAADELDPSLAIDPADGTVHLVYWVLDAAPRVMHREAPADLSAWSAPVQVSDAFDKAARPAAVVHGGLLRVIYEDHNPQYGTTPRAIVLATRSQGSFSYEVVGSTAHAEANWPEAHSAFGVLWIEWIDGTDTMGWRREVGGTWEPVHGQPYGSILERDYDVRGVIRRQALQ